MESIHKDAQTIYPIIVPTRSGLKSFNFYLIEEKESLILIDAGIKSEKCWTFLQDTLNEHGFTLDDLTQVIITHNHEDHVGLVDRIVTSHPVPVYAPEKSIHRLKRDPAYFEMRIDFFKELYEKMGCGNQGTQQIEKLRESMKDHSNRKLQTDVTPIKEGGLNGWNVIETPGHSPDHIVLWDQDRRRLFSGDHLIRHISSNAIVEPDQNGERLSTVSDYEQSLLRCLRLDADVVYPGHGDMIYNHKDLVKHRLNGIKRKANRLLEHVRSGITSGDELARTIYNDKYDSQFSLVMSEIIGHLDYLEQNGYIKKELKDRIWKYNVTDVKK